ncbi:MAG: LamG-like jellyroll fold domain-containing protein [Patescibacteria group bacterium]
MQHFRTRSLIALLALSVISAFFLAAPATAQTTFQETFDGDPSAPLPWRQVAPLNTWDVAVHSRDRQTFYQLDPMNAHHGSDCSPPLNTHLMNSYEGAVYQCKNHLMTAINGIGYALIYLTPNQMIDYSQGEAVFRFDMNTARLSDRDWIDIWIAPFDNNMQLPLKSWLPDLQGEAPNSVHIEMGTETLNGGAHTKFSGQVRQNGTVTDTLTGDWQSIEQIMATHGLSPDFRRRDTFELRISKTHIKFGMPDINYWIIDQSIQELGWDKGVIQIGQHSYNPTKGFMTNAQPQTWHWDNVEISPAVPFTIIRADKRYVGKYTANKSVTFPSAAPANSYLRFSAIGSSIEISLDNGTTWSTVTPVVPTTNSGAFNSYWYAVPEGTTTVEFRGTDWWGGEWLVKDMALFSETVVSSGGDPSPTPTAEPTVEPTVEPSPTEEPTPTEVPSPTPTTNPGLDPNLVSYWNMDDGSGTTASDTTGNNSGTVSGAQWVTGQENTALEFDGSNDSVDVGTFDIAGSALTIAGWVYIDDFGVSDARIISKATGVAEQDHYFMVSTIDHYGSKRLRFRLKTGGSTTTLIANSTGVLSTGQWVHVAAVYDGSSMILYKNGVAVGSTSKSGSLSTNNTVPVWIGNNPTNDRPFDGKIDELAIYDRALSATEIQQLAQ